jgi:hypothetical protein
MIMRLKISKRKSTIQISMTGFKHFSSTKSRANVHECHLRVRILPSTTVLRKLHAARTRSTLPPNANGMVACNPPHPQ